MANASANRSRTFGPIRERSDPAKVDALSAVRQRMGLRWDPIIDLFGGTARMRVAREKWLPQETAETTRAYEIRLVRSYLLPALEDTCDKIVAKPFSKPVMVENRDGLPDGLSGIYEDVDRCKTSIHDFGAMTFLDALKYGLTFCVVNSPTVDAGDTLADTDNGGRRPYLSFISAPNVLGVDYERLRDGTVFPTRVRIREWVEIQDGTYGTQEVCQIRVITAPPVVDGIINTGERGTIQVFRATTPEANEFQPVSDQIPHDYPGIPIVPGYFEKVGEFEASPPLERMAWKNIEHWQKSSDHNHALRFARFGILFGSGLNPEAEEEGLEIGPSRLITAQDPNASLEYVESNGVAIGLGASDLKAIEDQMEVLGMAPFVRNSGAVRATGQVIAETKSQTSISRWIHSHEAFLNECIRVAGVWTGEEIPEDHRIRIFKEFQLAIVGRSDMEIIDTARARNDIDRETYIEEGKRRGMFDENLTSADIEKRLAAEPPRRPIQSVNPNGIPFERTSEDPFDTD